MALLFQVGATVGAHVTLGVAVTFPQLHEHAAAERRDWSCVPEPGGEGFPWL